ncbi:nuclear RNA export factor 2-like [Myotis myotis]|uniref:nuclear RNA export factor 2-like n=1 Tax=Myotis myotis TaxID=51298 RepID=UPI001749D423|nr:nuclear RNA export factor 2-like [Myotis myotis]
MVHEVNDDGSWASLQGSEKGWSSLLGNFGNRTGPYQYGGYELQPPNLLKDDGNVEIRKVQRYQNRHTPYRRGQDRRRVQWYKKDCLRVTLCSNETHLRSEMENIQDQTLGSWFKVTVAYGRKYDRTWLMDSIQSHCSVPFTPVDFHHVQNKARFFVQDAQAASALKDVSNKIYDEENQKIAIFVSTSAVPFSVRDKLEPEIMEQLKLTMYKRYDASQKALDLQLLRYDPDLVRCDVDIILNRRNCMAATLQIIEKDFPELLSLSLYNNRLCQLDGLSDIIQMAPTVKILNLSKNELNSTWELCKIKGLKLEELWLEDNPLCGTFLDQSAYISAIRKCFPNLLRLDGHDLYPPIDVDIDSHYLVKPLKESYNGSDGLKNQVLHFLHQYYLIYDFGDRWSLLSAYHDEACFSLTIPYIPDNPAPSRLFEYLRDNEYMNFQNPNLRFQLLRHTKYDIVSTLCVLPKTQHDLNSFIVHIWFQSESILFLPQESLFFFRVHGVFKEGEGQSQDSVCAFTRTCIATPANNSSLCIINDELLVGDATPNKTQNAFPTQVPIPSFSTGPTLSQEQQKMEQVSSTPSGMSF